jgi:hypothetical protein
LYNFDGKINTIKISIDGINDRKYPIRNNHESRIDVIQSETKVRITRGTDK